MNSTIVLLLLLVPDAPIVQIVPHYRDSQLSFLEDVTTNFNVVVS